MSLTALSILASVMMTMLQTQLSDAFWISTSVTPQPPLILNAPGKRGGLVSLFLLHLEYMTFEITHVMYLSIK